MTGRPELDGLHLVGIPTYRGQPSAVGGDLVGTTLAGEPVRVAVATSDAWTLLLFLSSHCGGCEPLWLALARSGSFGPPGLQVAAVTRAEPAEDASALSGVAPPGVQLVMSERAWADYGVTGAPFFSLVEPHSGRVVTEGVAWGVEQTAGHVRRAMEGRPAPDVPRLSARDAPPSRAPSDGRS